MMMVMMVMMMMMMAPHGMMVADETCPYVAAQGPTRGKFGQTTSPPVAALVIKLIVSPSHVVFNIQAHV